MSLVMLSLELGIPLTELKRRMTLADYVAYMRYFAQRAESLEAEEEITTPEQMLAGWNAAT